MKLKDKYYNYILHGTKRIEIRLLDEKRRKIKIGDTIRFYKLPDMNENIVVKVIDLLYYNTIEELIRDNDMELLCDKKVTKEELIEIFNQIYSKEEQEKYGILGIKIAL